MQSNHSITHFIKQWTGVGKNQTFAQYITVLRWIYELWWAQQVRWDAEVQVSEFHSSHCSIAYIKDAEITDEILKSEKCKSPTFTSEMEYVFQFSLNYGIPMERINEVGHNYRYGAVKYDGWYKNFIYLFNELWYLITLWESVWAIHLLQREIDSALKRVPWHLSPKRTPVWITSPRPKISTWLHGLWVTVINFSCRSYKWMLIKRWWESSMTIRRLRKWTRLPYLQVRSRTTICNLRLNGSRRRRIQSAR